MKSWFKRLIFLILLGIGLSECRCPASATPVCEVDADCLVGSVCVSGICKLLENRGEHFFLEEKSNLFEEIATDGGKESTPLDRVLSEKSFCSPTNSACKPIPYTGCVAPIPVYESNKQRIPISATDWPEANLCQGACNYDDDCKLNGCGNHCTSKIIGPFSGICPGYDKLCRAFCGCVENRCVWFNQE